MTHEQRQIPDDAESTLRKEMAVERSCGAIQQIVVDLERELGVVPAFPATQHLCAAVDGLVKIARRIPR